LCSTNDSFVGLIEILLCDNITIFSDCFHTCLLTNTGDISCTNLVWSANVLFEINILRKIHFAGNSCKNKSFLSSIGKWEFNFSIKPSWTKQSWIQCISSICWHDDFYINILLETIHLVQQFDQNSLDLSISSCLSIKTSKIN